MRNLFRLRWWIAYFRLDSAIICEESAGLAPHLDFHDYPDSTTPYPWHFYTHTCRRCGKKFEI